MGLVYFGQFSGVHYPGDRQHRAFCSVHEAGRFRQPVPGAGGFADPRVPETNLSLLAWEARTAQQMWGDGEAEAK
jgi:hypothetical protein